MKQISIESIVSRSWDLATKNWPIFILIVIIESLFGNIGVNYDTTLLTNMGQHPDPQVLAEAMSDAITVSPWLIVGILLSTYLGFITYRFLRNCIVIGKPYENLGEELKIDLTQFAIFFVVELCFGIAVGLGCLLCILPGIFLGVRLMFAPLIAATEDVTFSQAFSRSWDMTKGHFWSLFLLGLAAFGIMIVGFLCCCVGIFFAEVIVNFMIMVVYFDLKEPEYMPYEETYYTEPTEPAEVVEPAEEPAAPEVVEPAETAEPTEPAGSTETPETPETPEV